MMNSTAIASHLRRQPFRSTLLLRSAIAVLAVCTAARSADAADCPRPGTLGTARVLEVDAKTTPRVGRVQFPETLPLADKEIVLTFDDGPNPPTTKRVLTALANECVQATFFLIGQSAAAHPDLVKTIAAAGHSIGHHTWSHPNAGQIPFAAAVDNITRGIAADQAALHGAASTAPTTGFFRFPYFVSTPALLDDVNARGLVVFGADLWASDWNPMTPAQELNLITARVRKAGRGIILFHDTKARTAAMLPDFLRFLRENGYHIVHVVPKTDAGDRK
jgi:peptidoglycan/xylan/chitin deacetylase (PgdA/CDA1 family)